MAGGGLRLLAQSLADILYPRVCCVCHDSLAPGERVMCLHCLDALPRTGIHTGDFNPLHQRLAGHVMVERAGAWFHYVRGSEYDRIIHDGKYRGMPSVMRDAGEMYAREIMPDDFFDGMTLLLPVPLHRGKLLRRGYNQAREIALGVSRATGIPVGDNLVARRGHSSQTRRNAWERLLNARGIYGVRNADELAGHHILVIDDVITTGATMLACLEAIHSAAPTASVSVLSLGATSLQ